MKSHIIYFDKSKCKENKLSAEEYRFHKVNNTRFYFKNVKNVIYKIDGWLDLFLNPLVINNKIYMRNDFHGFVESQLLELENHIKEMRKYLKDVPRGT